MLIVFSFWFQISIELSNFFREHLPPIFLQCLTSFSVYPLSILDLNLMCYFKHLCVHSSLTQIHSHDSWPLFGISLSHSSAVTFCLGMHLLCFCCSPQGANIKTVIHMVDAAGSSFLLLQKQCHTKTLHI